MGNCCALHVPYPWRLAVDLPSVHWYGLQVQIVFYLFLDVSMSSSIARVGLPTG